MYDSLGMERSERTYTVNLSVSGRSSESRKRKRRKSLRAADRPNEGKRGGAPGRRSAEEEANPEKNKNKNKYKNKRLDGINTSEPEKDCKTGFASSGASPAVRTRTLARALHARTMIQ